MRLKIITCFIIIFYFAHRSETFYHLTPFEMNDLFSIFHFTGNHSSKECLLALQNKWYPEIPYVYTVCNNSEHIEKPNKPDPKQCEGFDCWESQLTDTTRFDILNTMNKYRKKVALGKCAKWCKTNNKTLIFELRWIFLLEWQAIDVLKKCPREMEKLDEKVVDQPGYAPLNITYILLSIQPAVVAYRDTIVVSFSTQTGLQREMRLIVRKLITDNHFKDWDDQLQFRRGITFDVGCAYTVRRNVSYVTSLGEEVKSGNVGHLACLFVTSEHDRDPKLNNAAPSDENCLRVFFSNKIWFDNIGATTREYYFYPLCFVRWDAYSYKVKSVTNHCWRGLHSKRNTQWCDVKNKFSPTTWNENFYGLQLMVDGYNDHIRSEARCSVPKNIPQPRKEGPDIFNYNCTLKYEVFLEVDTGACSKWNCQESQLRDVTKLRMLQGLNEARHTIANGKCSKKCSSSNCTYCSQLRYCDMTNLRWHWFLEWKASQMMRKCITPHVMEEVYFEDGPFHEPVFYEKISLVFDLPSSEGQLALPKIFTNLFWNNFFFDWSQNNRFRRANAVWIGCSIAVRPGATVTQMNPKLKLKDGIPTHIICIYASLDKQLKSTIGSPSDQNCCLTCTESSPVNPCYAKLKKNIPPFPNLCTSVLLEITMNCEKNYCSDSSKSKAWETRFKGITSCQNVDGSFQAIIRDDSPTSSERVAAYARKYCIVLMLFYIVLLSILCFVLSLVFLYEIESSVFQK